MTALWGLLLSIGLPTVAMHPWTSRALESSEDSIYRRLLALSMAFGVGIGLCSMVAFLALWFNNGIPTRYLFVEGVSLLVIAMIGIFQNCRKSTGNGDTCLSSCLGVDDGLTAHHKRWVFGVFAATMAVALATMIVMSLDAPHGRWDAWCIWNLRARFLYLGGPHWQRMFDPSIHWSHPDYPLLLPMTIARAWLYNGAASTVEPAGISIIFTLATAMAVSGFVGVLRGSIPAALAGLLVIGSKYFIRHGAYQYADTPLAFYFVLSLGLVLVCLESRKNSFGIIALLGLSCGCAAWTKNEGLPFALFCVALGTVVQLRKRKIIKNVKNIAWILLCFLPGLAITIAMKTQLAPPNDLMSSHDQFMQLLDFERYVKTAMFLLRATLSFGEGAIILSLAVTVLLCMGRKTAWRTAAVGLSLTIAMSCTYFLVFLLTPHDLDWHLTTAGKRLILQLFPCVVMVTLLLPQDRREDQSHDKPLPKMGSA